MKNKKLCPITVGNYFFKKFGEKDILKLNKLVYYSYCWYRVLVKKSLTFEKLIKTKYGIFFNSLLNSVFNGDEKQRYISEPIPYKNFTCISNDISKLLDKIWTMYGDKDSVYLSALCNKDEKNLIVGDYIPNKVIHKNYILKENSAKRK